jgi:predicted nicotinamide N-methyase
MVTPEAAEAFIRANTALGRAPLVPEFALYLATEITPIWQATEAWLQAGNIAPPFWAFAWPGSQAIAREILDRPALVAGRRVLDFAAGCGLAGLAAAKAGAASVEAAEIDPLAVAATLLNARENGLQITGFLGDAVGSPCRWDIIFTGDVFYEAPMTRHILPWLQAMAEAGAEVLVADPGRAYLPRGALTEIARYDVPTSRELEDHTQRLTVLYRLGPKNTVG